MKSSIIDSNRTCNIPQKIVRMLAEKNLTLSCAESCTGGLIAKQITDVAGCSTVFFGGAVTYTNEVKHKLLGVRTKTLQRYTEVSKQTAVEMAIGARRRFRTDFALATTGYAGPSGGTAQNPVGTVYIALSSASGVWVIRHSSPSDADRATIRENAARTALLLLKKHLEP